VPVIGLFAVLRHDQRNNPHRIPINYPLRNVMLTAQSFDKSGRTRSEYDSLTAFIERWARNQMRPYATCDECGAVMHKEFPASEHGDLDYRQVFNARFASFFLCSPCAENWLAEGDAGLPRITGLKHHHNHDERWAQDGKDKLPTLPPSGALFAGLVLPGGAEPISVPLRAGASRLLHISSILNTFCFDWTEVTA
jgi:hypothetical protein